MRHTLAVYPPDLLIEVPRTACRSLEFYRASEVIEIGQEIAALALDTFVDVDPESQGTGSHGQEPETPSDT
jgi:NTE family protein